MNGDIYKNILNSKSKKFILLVDPDKHDKDSIEYLAQIINESATDFIFIGGSLVSGRIDSAIEILKKNTAIPVILFPGSLLQLSDKADGILLLSLISGRNPDYLIGNHVLAAPFLKKSNLEVIPTGYILIGDENTSSVEYISHTKPIPASKHDLVIATVLAGEMLGNKLIYLEAGSGASKCLPTDLIHCVKQNLSIPLIVGGGIKTADDVRRMYLAGAEIVVVGSAVEHDPLALIPMSEISNSVNLLI